MAVASWKLRDEIFQDKHNKLAPRVLKERVVKTRSCKAGRSTASSRRSEQDARFCAALEQLAQMCAGFLAATRIAPAESGASIASASPHLRMNIHVGDAIDFCDAILASSVTAGAPEGSVRPSASNSDSLTFEGIAFQQGTLQPFRLRKDTFWGLRTEFDVISTGNLAEHLGKQSVICDYGNMNARHLRLSVDTENPCLRIKRSVCAPCKISYVSTCGGTGAPMFYEETEMSVLFMNVFLCILSALVLGTLQACRGRCCFNAWSLTQIAQEVVSSLVASAPLLEEC